jgi:alkanesulfonate monooxygenase SsuD/methylene tetrahydromethanopterin reductase-like flavin-dependent oxidoreductase (luciferase family)
MQTYYFSETPYPGLPPEESYESIRVNLPNANFDPRVGADLYHQRFDEWQAADELGLNMMVNEHHQTATCIQPAVGLSAAVLARITKHGRILVLGNPLPNRPDPVRVAEEMAVIDNISRGRLEAGFVKSVPYEILPANSSSLGMTDRLWESTELIIKAWTTHDGPFSWQGHYHYRNVNIWPRPYQQPHPPIWMTTSSPGSVPRIAQNGYVMGTFVGGHVFTKKLFDVYRGIYRETKRTDSTPADRLAYAALVAVADTTEGGLDRLRAMQWYFDANKSPRYLLQPAGFVPPEATLAMARSGPPTSGPGAAKGKNAEWLVEHGMAFAGSPDDVYEQLRKFYVAVGGFGHLLMMGHAGPLTHESAMDTITRFANEVQPRLADLSRELVWI